MTSLKEPKLGTPKTSWPYYSLHRTTSYILKEYFLISNYTRCIKNAFGYYDQLNKNLETLEKLKRGVPNKDLILANAKELSDWAKETDAEEYHEVCVHSFIGMWSALEAGLENIISDFVENDRDVADCLASKFKKGRYDIESWPWSEEVILDITGKIETKAKNSTDNGGVDYASRLQTLFEWMDIHVQIEQKHKALLAEANRLRNILLHRYGEVSEKDASDFPKFRPWCGKTVPMNKYRFENYYTSIQAFLIALMQAINTKVSNKSYKYFIPVEA